MKKRLFSLLLAVVMAVLLIPSAGAASSSSFYDLSDSADAMAAESLRLMGIMEGYAGGAFRPDAQLTRAQFCKMAICALNAENQLGLYSTVTVYPDVKPSHWAAAYINMAAKGKNIISGYPNGKFYPDRTVTLGQAVTILLRMLGYKDENVGGVWPDSYVAAAAREGLMDGLRNTNGSAPLTRRDAAYLFVNLLRTDSTIGEEGVGGSFVSTIGVETQKDVVLVSSSATGPDGKTNALQLSSGQIYQLVNDTQSSGVFNGYKGTLLLKNGKVLTFLPDAQGSSRAITVAAVSALQITDTNGFKYAVTNDTKVQYQGEEQDWSKVYTWLNPGASLTLYLGSAGNVEYIFVGGGSVASEAVVVYDKGSTKGFDSLTGGIGGYKIYKNGSSANASDMRPYDVATYSSATNTIRVCDTRLTGYYESCVPSPTEPTSIKVFGQNFPVLTTAQATLARFRPGDQITLLLTEDNQVAGAVKPGTAGANTNAIGIARSVTQSSAKVDLLCGITIEASVYLGENEAALMNNQPVQVASTGRNSIGLVRLGGGVSGALDLETRKLGNNSLAETVKVFRYTAEGLEAISLSDLGGGPIANGEISYAHLNWANRVDIIVLGGVNSSSGVFYGRTSVTMDSDENSDRLYMTVINPQGRMGPFRLTYNIPGGTYVAARKNSSGTAFDSLQQLTRLREVPNSAWTGQGAVTVAGRTYTISGTVMCYNRDTASWISLEEAHAYAKQCDMYASDDGVIRAIEVGGR